MNRLPAFIAWPCLKRRTIPMPNDENSPTDSAEEPKSANGWIVTSERFDAIAEDGH
ncbi:MAG TPA: hypothetical protein VGN42_02465 [Pirellulales bacterium]|jgi:hypothetical protein|nr:hypothetical protein [Pirellulales bacterium]